ncbi:MAG: YceI family protein [Tepidiformaceae bacterium]
MPWNLDTSHSSVEFAVKHMVISTTKGRFADYEVDANVDETNVANSTATVRIAAGSIDSRDEKRDSHLRSADFFDAENHPYITFKSTRFESKGGDDYKLIGDLTIRGVTNEIALDSEITGPVTDPWGGVRYGISANAKIHRKDWGLTWNGVLEAGGLVVGDDVKLSIETELVKAA